MGEIYHQDHRDDHGHDVHDRDVHGHDDRDRDDRAPEHGHDPYVSYLYANENRACGDVVSRHVFVYFPLLYLTDSRC